MYMYILTGNHKHEDKHGLTGCVTDIYHHVTYD